MRIRLWHGSPALAAAAPELSRAAALGGIDVVATRIWLDRTIETDTPANVFSRFEELRGAGGTFFMLDQLQPDHDALWGGETPQVTPTRRVYMDHTHIYIYIYIYIYHQLIHIGRRSQHRMTMS